MTPSELQSHQTLIHCACINLNPAQQATIVQQAGQYALSPTLPTAAEEHGLAPLLYAHLQRAGVDIPAAVKRDLLALTLRHRHANRARGRVLAEILAAYDAAGIEVRVLKGMALAHLIYPEPGLRPMRDIDLLVKPAEARRAQALLAELGFRAPLAQAGALPDKHLSAAKRQTEGLSISVEVHHNLFNASTPVAPMGLADLTVAPLHFSVNGQMAQTLGGADMLWHLGQHFIYHLNVAEPMRFIWIADLVGFAEQYAADIDWARVADQQPTILNVLSLLHFAAPLSDELRRRAGIELGREPSGIGRDFAGWPRAPLAQQRAKGYRRLLADTFLPGEWWLRLHYGLGSTRSLFWTRWVRHPFNIGSCLWRVLRERLAQPRSQTIHPREKHYAR